MLKNNAKVTVVISTYNRPDVLGVAIKSVILQTFSDWKIIVIGDNSDKETEKVVASFNDPRIKYINLPFRIGEQSGPNSVGMALTMTEYLAFLNQDDVWLQDHLEYAIETLEKTTSDFFVGKCGFARKSNDITGNLKEPIFDLVNPDNRTPDMSFDKTLQLFESASSWVIKTEKAKKIGYWKQARELHRSPIQNWLTRAWRKKTMFVFGDKISVLNIRTHNLEKNRSRYAVKSLEHNFILDLLENHDFNSLRRFVEKSLEQNKIPFPTELKVLYGKNSHRVLRKIFFNRFTKNIFKYTGIDSYEIYFCFLRSEKGKFLKDLSIARTGKPLPDKVDLKMLIDEVKISFSN